MSDNLWEPDVIVGVDFGMTSTGVAYSETPEWARPETIQHWPESPGGTADKVDTALSYDKHTGKLAKWGFSVDPFNDRFRVEESFKLWLDPQHRSSFPDAPSLRQAQSWYRDYLSCIYRETCQYLGGCITYWTSKRVLWVFSVPTTWKDVAMIEETKRIIVEAGFGKNRNHKMEVTLTEAEAAAVYVAKPRLQKGDVFLVCDAGGGTTDCNILKVTSSDIAKTELYPLACVQGAAIGSTLIDFKIEKKLEERLKLVRHHLRGEPHVIAHKMMKSRFESFKRSFGKPETNLEVPMRILGMEPGLDFPQARISDSKIFITQKELRDVFDEQVSRIFKLIDDEFRGLQHSHAGERLSYLVLSGGLGSSPYVRSELQTRYERGSEFANAENIKILSASKPQLAVVHGLVMDQVQKLKTSKVVSTTVRCRASYGVLVREPYDPVRHLNETVVMDRYDGRRWAENQIHWFIKQGEPILVEEGKAKSFSIKLDRGQEKKPWSCQVLMSNRPANQLPSSMKGQGAKTVCAVESVMKDKDLKLKNRHWYNSKPEYFRAEFSVKVFVGQASLKFEVVGKDGIVSTTSEEIKVQWMMSTSEDNDVKDKVTQISYGLEERF